jgi:hypothetical protein
MLKYCIFKNCFGITKKYILQIFCLWIIRNRILVHNCSNAFLSLSFRENFRESFVFLSQIFRENEKWVFAKTFAKKRKRKLSSQPYTPPLKKHINLKGLRNKKALARESGAQGVLFDEKNRGSKNLVTLSL